VPSSVVTTISSYMKVFLGELIETARRVQVEWMALQDTFPNGEAIPEDATLKEVIKPEWRGPLTPDHLREALRRMKKDRKGGAAGFMGVSLAGKVSSVPKMGGRKLFR
jgi:transcription initiation factor TFIID subunit 11